MTRNKPGHMLSICNLGVTDPPPSPTDQIKANAIASFKMVLKLEKELKC